MAFLRPSSSVTTETHVTSDPVPAVVGTWIRGTRWPLARLLPYISSMGWALLTISATSLAVSRELPPPMPSTPSASMARAACVAACTTDTGGSAATSLNTSAAIPAFASAPFAVSTKPGKRCPDRTR